MRTFLNLFLIFTGLLVATGCGVVFGPPPGGGTGGPFGGFDPAGTEIRLYVQADTRAAQFSGNPRVTCEFSSSVAGISHGTPCHVQVSPGFGGWTLWIPGIPADSNLYIKAVATTTSGVPVDLVGATRVSAFYGACPVSINTNTNSRHWSVLMRNKPASCTANQSFAFGAGPFGY